MRSATCHNLSLLGTHSISDLWTHVRWVSYYLAQTEEFEMEMMLAWSAPQQLASTWKADIIWEVIFVQVDGTVIILANDLFCKDTSWFVVIRVGSIPTQHKSVHANIPVQQYSFVTSLTSKLVDKTYKRDVPNSCWKCSFPFDFDSKVCNLVSPSACQGFGNNTEEWWGQCQSEVTLLTITALTTMIKNPHPTCHCNPTLPCICFFALTLTITWSQWKANSFLTGPAWLLPKTAASSALCTSAQHERMRRRKEVMRLCIPLGIDVSGNKQCKKEQCVVK